MSLFKMIAASKTAEAEKMVSPRENKCGKCPHDGTQTSRDEDSGYCYCPKCQQMFSPAGTR
ncbi:MAG: hypothetical protein A2Z08_07975 [Deltaproteobacteria bacterium RBG_16_54_11]|nr:MAG: hypothetical protein A2Z08_07975 [Deltaproteobacteria bacterium RBG_16_54_11]